MKKSSRILAIATTAAASAAILVLVASPPALAKNKKHEVGAVLVGGIVGVAVAAALSENHKHRKDVYYPNYQPAYPPGGYDPYFAKVFYPSSDVACYPAQRVCYNTNGSVAGKWTQRVYGY